MTIGNYNSSYYNTLFGMSGGKSDAISTLLGGSDKKDALSSLSSIGSIYSASKTASTELYNSIFANTQSVAGSLNLGAFGSVGDLKTGSAEMSGAIKSLTSGAAFRQNGVISSDTDAMSVSSAGKNAALEEKTVKIDQIATGQVNEGEAMDADGRAGFSSRNQFSVEVGGKTYQFNVSVASGDTNKDVQQKMADAINKRGIGITATVSENDSDNTSALTISANGTGDDDKNRFAIKDISGNAVAKTGADNITQEAGNALYSINGGEQRSSKTNAVDLGDGVTATLKKASDAEIKVSYGTDAGRAIDEVENLVNSFNKLYSAAVDNSGNVKSDRLLSKLNGVSTMYANSLENVGIGFDDSGKMTMDSEKLKAAAADGSLEKLFTQDSGRNYGLGNRLDRIAGSVSQNTAMYMDKSSLQNSVIETMGYSGTGAFATSTLPYSGLLLDLML